MEHQSSVTYGNWFRNGYLQRDPCACGVGFKFDFIIIHESAHEWFANNISMKDAADMWFEACNTQKLLSIPFGKKMRGLSVVPSRLETTPDIGVYGSNRTVQENVSPKAEQLHTIAGHHDARRAFLRRGLKLILAQPFNGTD